MIASAIVFALLLGIFVFWVLPRGSLWRRTLSVGMFVLLIAVVYGGALEMMSRPKTVRLEWRDLKEATVLAASMREGEAIYVWLQMDGAAEPRSYALPWSIQQAQELQQAMADAEQSGTGVKVSQPFESSLDTGEPKFYALPQPALPPKPDTGDGPLVFQQPQG
jgi:hypothetical protein